MNRSLLFRAVAAGVSLVALVALAPAGAGAHVEDDVGAWTVRDAIRDVDMAAFAREHAAGQTFAAAPAAQDRVRDALRATYAAGGLAPVADESATFAQAAVQQHQYYDECDDGTNLPAERQHDVDPHADTDGPPPQLDLRSMLLGKTTDSSGRPDQTGFLVYTCREWDVAHLGAGGITFGLYVSYETSDDSYPTLIGDEPEDGPDFLVSFFPEHNVPERPIQIMAVRTPTRDPGTWTLTWLDRASRLDRFQVDGVVPTSAIGDRSADNGIAWTVAVGDSQAPNEGVDWFPEGNYQLRDIDDGTRSLHVPTFPFEDCTGGAGAGYQLTPQQVSPNDPGYPLSWAMPQIRAPEAWATLTDSSVGGRTRPVTVAVIDAGIDGTRYDFMDPIPRTVAGYDAVYNFELEGIHPPGIGPFVETESVGYRAAPTLPRNSDRGPHGTAVAGLIGARGGNGAEIAGVDWGARMMPVRVVDVNGCISSLNVANGIIWAVNHGADIVNVSLVGALDDETDYPPDCNDGIDNDGDAQIDAFGGPSGEPPDVECAGDITLYERSGPGLFDCEDGVDNDGDGGIDHEGVRPPGSDPPADADCEDATDFEDPAALGRSAMRNAIDYALEQGVPIVAAAGNLGSGEDPLLYPAAYPGVFSVGATTRAGEVAPYSSTGRHLMVVAPGGVNNGSASGDLMVLWDLDQLRPRAGTSYSTPLVTGALALYLGLNPHIQRGYDPANPPSDNGYQRTIDDLRVALINAARDLAPAGHDPLSGRGLINVDRMLDVPALGGPLADPARAQLPRVDVNEVIEITAELAKRAREAGLAASHAVLARADVFADALAGAALTGDGPLLLAYHDSVPEATLQGLREALPNGGTVYLLGGEQALGPAVAEALSAAGYHVVRLAGPSRVETALAVAAEVRRLHPEITEVALARADGEATAAWADSISGGAWAADARVPMLLTSSGALHPAVAAALDAWQPSRTVLLGGEAALAPAVEAAVPAPFRVAGPDRAATAVAVAQQLWGDAAAGGFLIVNGTYARAWAPALAAAGWAAATDRPLLFTGGEDVLPPTAEALSAECPDDADVALVGGATFITGSAEAAIAEALAC